MSDLDEDFLDSFAAGDVSTLRRVVSDTGLMIIAACAVASSGSDSGFSSENAFFYYSLDPRVIEGVRHLFRHIETSGSPSRHLDALGMITLSNDLENEGHRIKTDKLRADGVLTEAFGDGAAEVLFDNALNYEVTAQLEELYLQFLYEAYPSIAGGVDQDFVARNTAGIAQEMCEDGFFGGDIEELARKHAILGAMGMGGYKNPFVVPDSFEPKDV